MLQRVDEPGDAELISAVRGGDVDAYGELFGRHVDAARRLARQLTTAADADDLVSDAFAKVLVVLKSGGGPDLAFRAYLLTAVRRLHVDRIRATSRLHTTDDMEAFDPGVPFRDTAVEGFENAAAARAFASLPERWQLVLWHTEVEGQKPAEVATLLGISANSVSALAYRAREGLRQAFLTMHARELEDDACRWTHQNLGAYIRDGISRRDAAKVEAHLAECRPCTGVYLELTEVNSNLSGILAPLLLGGLAAAYAGSGSGVAAHGGLLLLFDRARDFVAAHAPASAAAGVAATVVAGSAVFVAIDRGPDPAAPESPTAARAVPERVPQQRRVDKEPLERPVRDRGDGPAARATTSPTVPAEAPVAAPAPAAPAGDEPAQDGPAEGPREGGGPEPDDTPDTDHDTEPGPPPAADLRVSATASRQGAVYEVVVDLTGLADGATGTLEVRGAGTVVVITADGRCRANRIDDSTCEVPATPTAFVFRAVAPTGGTLSFTVSSTAADADPSNNRATVTLAS